MRLPKYFHYAGTQRTIAGHGALRKLPGIMASLGSSRPLLVTDRGVQEAGLTELVLSVLGASKPSGNQENAITVSAVFSDVPADSDTHAVARGAAMFREGNCDSIVAVGGGSVMDTAKGIRMVSTLGGDDLSAYSGAGRLQETLIPLYAVPTTSGSGSEATQVAVIKDHDTGRKISYTSPYLIPDAAVLDPLMTVTLPPLMTAATGMDALTHAIEAFISLAKNPLSDSASLQAVELAARNLPQVIINPHDEESRLQMAVASHLAGAAFSNSMVSIVHTLGHCAGSVCGIPHGICMGILLSYGLEYNLHMIRSEISLLLLPLRGKAEYMETKPSKRPEAVIASIRGLAGHLHELTARQYPLRFRDVQRTDGSLVMEPQHIPVIARLALGDPSQFYNPEQVDYHDMVRVLEAAYWGYALDQGLVKKGHQK